LFSLHTVALQALVAQTNLFLAYMQTGSFRQNPKWLYRCFFQLHISPRATGSIPRADVAAFILAECLAGDSKWRNKATSIVS
jgi:hypothetical protein